MWKTQNVSPPLAHFGIEPLVLNRYDTEKLLLISYLQHWVITLAVYSSCFLHCGLQNLAHQEIQTV